MQAVTLHPARNRTALVGAFLLSGLLVAPQADALVVRKLNGVNDGSNVNISAPADDPGWYNTTDNNNSTHIYLGDQWVMTAGHVNPNNNTVLTIGQDEFGEDIKGYFPLIPNSAIRLSNPSFVSGSTDSDILIYRVGYESTLGVTPEEFGQGLLQPISLAQDPTLPGDEVLMIGRGRVKTVNTNDTLGEGLFHWTVGSGSSPTWSSPSSSGGNTLGFTAIGGTSTRVKTWGTNVVATDTYVDNTFMNVSGDDANDYVVYELNNGGVAVSMLTRFDLDAGIDEAQGVSGDSGGPVFRKEDDGSWVLAGITSALFYLNSTQEDNEPTAVVEGMHTAFSDLSQPHYRDQIAALLANDFETFEQISGETTDLAGYSIAGDINLDGVANGDGFGDPASDDVAAFIAGWLHEQAEGDINSWTKGDLNLDGITDLADFALLRSSVGGVSPTVVELLTGSAVPEPGSAALLALAMAALCGRRRR